ncbi:hypothetical protein [Solimicrobium silvestre]|uniref:Uncharacterized protein n=1 Tax=Solimicrobium silvestre TaxID=2099400 RepID=A0A2S9GZY6_9BURK|nr:hypothetical protein [Solimicrobium silvestre]PRC93299.1 hypothetical protein S2091_2037 [Solimicrobium silvestre]
MIYEIQIRATGSKQYSPQSLSQSSSEQLIWVESSLPTRAFEQWLVKRNLLNFLGNGAVARWSIVQTKRPAHFVLDSEERALEQRIAALMHPTSVVKKVPAITKAHRDLHLSEFALAA